MHIINPRRRLVRLVLPGPQSYHLHQSSPPHYQFDTRALSPEFATTVLTQLSIAVEFCHASGWLTWISSRRTACWCAMKRNPI